MRSSSNQCVDANLVVKLVVHPNDEPVQRLWVAWTETAQRLVAPTLLPYEVTNALYRMRYVGQMSGEAFDAALAAALAQPIEIVHDPTLHLRAAAMAARFPLSTVYDAHYLALAEQLNADFWTLDQRLVNSVRHRLSWVHLVE